jgi:hypothetical protein
VGFQAQVVARAGTAENGAGKDEKLTARSLFLGDFGSIFLPPRLDSI